MIGKCSFLLRLCDDASSGTLAPMEKGQRASWRRWLQPAAAIAAGNLLYFSLLPYLPKLLQHQIFQIDLGLAVDFLFCVGAYFGLRRWWFGRRV